MQFVSEVHKGYKAAHVMAMESVPRTKDSSPNFILTEIRMKFGLITMRDLRLLFLFKCHEFMLKWYDTESQTEHAIFRQEIALSTSTLSKDHLPTVSYGQQNLEYFQLMNQALFLCDLTITVSNRLILTIKLSMPFR